MDNQTLYSGLQIILINWVIMEPHCCFNLLFYLCGTNRASLVGFSAVANPSMQAMRPIWHQRREASMGCCLGHFVSVPISKFAGRQLSTSHTDRWPGRSPQPPEPFPHRLSSPFPADNCHSRLSLTPHLQQQTIPEVGSQLGQGPNTQNSTIVLSFSKSSVF